MKIWRVGTVSMGLSLILLGVFLFLSQIKGLEGIEPILIWWPFILVVLGAEIILYLLLSKQENPRLKYDFMSILFVCIIGTIGIGFTLLSSSGLLGEFQSVLGSQEKTLDLPEMKEELSNTIKRIVVESENQPVTIEGSELNEVHMFGTYRTTVSKNDKGPIQFFKDYALTKTVGNTLYVYVKDSVTKNSPFHSSTRMKPTIIVPQNMRLEVRGNNSAIDLFPGALANHWIIESNSSITINIDKNNDMSLTAVSVNELRQQGSNWDSVEQTNENNEYDKYGNSYKGTMKIGDGTYRLDILKSNQVSINLVEDM
ncbi:hypothetical protein PY093_20260 [Cytobacillus sp. S13-E01]|uniref:hypothetical protein n=1 Tax=Cytobacillus sp. S13-E01 TaxID=3031326 RepID=UPI0023D84B4D|nr:hypothetical protein [Cytobacillus sp. S13-E01]MDF0728950.1 hypothetical protein [Cytobacillus sp. S13-E01]